MLQQFIELFAGLLVENVCEQFTCVIWFTRQVYQDFTYICA